MVDINTIAITCKMAADTDVGGKRTENEDFYYFSEAKKSFFLGDGMGGHAKGAIASKLACETLRDIFNGEGSVNHLSIGANFADCKKVCGDIAQPLSDTGCKLITGIRLANRRILQYSITDKAMRGMGTTFIGAIVSEQKITFAHVGDSRVYRLRKGKLSRLTRDHSWLNELIEDNEISEKDAKTFSKKNVLTRALGIAPGAKIDFHEAVLQKGDLFLLCTDGLYNALADDLITSILTAHYGSLDNKAHNLIKKANTLDGSDNITAGLIYIDSVPETNNEPIETKVTFPEEPHSTDLYLDQKARQIYNYPAHRVDTKKIATISGISALALIALAALFLFERSDVVKKSKGDTGLFSNIKNEELHRSPDMDRITELVKVQVGKTKHLYKQTEAKIAAPGHKAFSPQSDSDIQGFIYLNGDFGSPKYDDTKVFLNNKVVGALRDFIKQGIPLEDETYHIEIIGSSDELLFEKKEVKVEPREVRALKF